MKQEDVEYIRKHYDPNRLGSIKEIAEHLGCTPGSVNYQIRKIGIFKRHIKKNRENQSVITPEMNRVYFSIYHQADYLYKRGVPLEKEPRILALEARENFKNGLPVYNLDGSLYSAEQSKTEVADKLREIIQNTPNLTPPQPKPEKAKSFMRGSVLKDKPKHSEQTRRPGILVGYVPGVRPKGLYQRMMAECIV